MKKILLPVFLTSTLFLSGCGLFSGTDSKEEAVQFVERELHTVTNAEAIEDEMLTVLSEIKYEEVFKQDEEEETNRDEQENEEAVEEEVTIELNPKNKIQTTKDRLQDMYDRIKSTQVEKENEELKLIFLSYLDEKITFAEELRKTMNLNDYQTIRESIEQYTIRKPTTQEKYMKSINDFLANSKSELKIESMSVSDKESEEK